MNKSRRFLGRISAEACLKMDYFGIKGELRELEFYFRKIPRVASTKIFGVSVLSNSAWLSRNLKNAPK